MMPTMVILSLEDAEGLRCVDVFMRADGTFGFKEYRRDPEDSGRWSLIADYSGLSYTTREDALRAASANISWLADMPRS